VIKTTYHYLDIDRNREETKKSSCSYISDVENIPKVEEYDKEPFNQDTIGSRSI
jgi:hypothetical protein